MKWLRLEGVSLVTVSSVNLRRAVSALRWSMHEIDFHAAILLSHRKPSFLDAHIQFTEIPKISSLDEYSRFVLFELNNHVHTSHCLIVQADGYVVNPQSWSDRFLDYDYVGAPWPDGDAVFLDQRGQFQRVGNGGFSLRSTRLMERASQLSRESGTEDRSLGIRNHYEDVEICVTHRLQLESEGFRFAPVEVAAQFATERVVPESVATPFGFHGAHPHRRGWSKTDAIWGWSFIPMVGHG